MITVRQVIPFIPRHFVSVIDDYIPTRTSVIGALKRELDIRVREMARHKAEDLRQNFYCWWSHPLPPNKPYR